MPDVFDRPHDHESLADLVKASWVAQGQSEATFARDTPIPGDIHGKFATAAITASGTDGRDPAYQVKGFQTIGHLIDAIGFALGIGPYPRHPWEAVPDPPLEGLLHIDWDPEPPPELTVEQAAHLAGKEALEAALPPPAPVSSSTADTGSSVPTDGGESTGTPATDLDHKG